MTDGDRATPPPAIPLLGMMIDRSSFDETDDFCIDHDALEMTQWAKEQKEGLVDFPPPVLLRNGKVRRRLRWRPRNMMKRRRNPSDASVGSLSVMSGTMSVGNLSQTSRISRKSVHSFASTETQVKSNTRKSKNAIFGRNSASRLPLPRPNYPDHFSEQKISTIGTEGGLIHARMEKSGEGTAAVLVQPSHDGDASESVAEGELELVLPQEESSHAASLGSRKTEMKTSPPRIVTPPKASKKKPGMPPLFQQRRPSQVTPELNKKNSRSAEHRNKKTSPSPTETTEATMMTSAVSDDESVPLNILSTDETEADRQVDLRIVRMLPGERRGNSSTRPGQETHGSKPNSRKVGSLSIAELRADQKASSSFSNPKEDGGPPQQVSSDDETPSLTSTGGVELEDFTDDESDDSLLQTPSPTSADELHPPAASSELRFSMWPSRRTQSSTGSERTPPSPVMEKAHTGPVDLDDGSFLEVEKNLQAILDVATEHLKQKEYTEALEVFEEILRGQLARYGEKHYRVGTAHHNIGIVHTKRGDYQNAIKSYKRAIIIRKKTLGQNHADVAVSLAQLGVAYLESNKHKKAITAFRKALKIRRLCYGNRHPKVAKILNNIGCALYEIDELEVAKVAFEEALHIQRYLLQSLPVNSMVNSQTQLLSIASTQSNIASIKLYHGEFDEALVDLEEALLVQQCVLSDDHPIVKRTEESIVWVEKSRNVATGRSSGELDLVSRLTGFGSMLSTGSLLSTGSCDNELTLRRGKDDEPSMSVFNLLERRFMELHANLDIACGGDGGNTVYENDEDDDDISSAPSSSGPRLSKKYSL